MDKDKAIVILNESACDEWDRPILDHLAARWALAEIERLRAEIERLENQEPDSVLDGDRSEIRLD